MTPVRRDIPGGYYLTDSWVIGAGHLVVRETWQTITGGDGTESEGSWCTLREAWLDGHLITDPARAQALYDEARAIR